MENIGSTSRFEREPRDEESGGDAVEKLKKLAKKKAAEEELRKLLARKKEEQTPPPTIEKKQRSITWLKTAEKQTTTPTPEAEKDEAALIQERKRAFLKEKTAHESAALRQKLEQYPVGSLQNQQAQAELAVNNAIAEKIEDPDTEADAIIEAEFDRRMALITEADLDNFEQSEISGVPEIEPTSAELAVTDNAVLPKEEGHDTSDRVGRNTPQSADSLTPASMSVNPDGEPVTLSPVAVPSPVSPNIQPPQPSINPNNTPDTVSPPFSGGIDMPLRPTTSYRGAPTPSTANTAPSSTIAEKQLSSRERKSTVGPLLAGAAVGYAFGYNRGKRKSEAKFQPAVQNAQREVAQTKRAYSAKQAELRSAVAARHQETPQQTHVPKAAEYSAPPTVLEKVQRNDIENGVSVEKLKPQSMHEYKTVAPEQQKKLQVETPPFYTQELRPIVPSRQESKNYHTETRPQMPMPSTERVPGNRPPSVAEQVLEQRPRATAEQQAIPAKKFEQLSTQDILRAAESLHVDGVSVRQLYESNQIDRSGLIKIVRESMQGGDIKTVLKNVRLGHERQLERAHEFKHGDGSFSSTADDTTAQLKPHQEATSQVAALALQAQQAAQAAIQPNQQPQAHTAQPDPSNVVPLSAPPSQQINNPESTSQDTKKSPLPVIPLIIFTIGVFLIVFWLISNI